MERTHGASQHLLQLSDNTFRQVAHLAGQSRKALGFGG
jgi:hypothetical protein